MTPWACVWKITTNLARIVCSQRRSTRFRRNHIAKVLGDCDDVRNSTNKHQACIQYIQNCLWRSYFSFMRFECGDSLLPSGRETPWKCSLVHKQKTADPVTEGVDFMWLGCWAVLIDLKDVYTSEPPIAPDCSIKQRNVVPYCNSHDECDAHSLTIIGEKSRVTSQFL